MLVMLSGKIQLVKLRQVAKALVPMLVTLFGIVMFLRFEHPSNADSPILVIPSDITTLVSPEPLKADVPMLVTLPGIVMLVRLEQPENVPYPMNGTPYGMVTPAKLVQL